MGIIITAGSGMLATLLAIGVIADTTDTTITRYPVRSVAVIFPFAALAVEPWLPLTLVSDVLRVVAAVLFLAIIISVIVAWREEKRTALTHFVWTMICGVAGFGLGWLVYRTLL